MRRRGAEQTPCWSTGLRPLGQSGSCQQLAVFPWAAVAVALVLVDHGVGQAGGRGLGRASSSTGQSNRGFFHALSGVGTSRPHSGAPHGRSIVSSRGRVEQTGLPADQDTRPRLAIQGNSLGSTETVLFIINTRAVWRVLLILMPVTWSPGCRHSRSASAPGGANPPGTSGTERTGGRGRG